MNASVLFIYIATSEYLFQAVNTFLMKGENPTALKGALVCSFLKKSNLNSVE